MNDYPNEGRDSEECRESTAYVVKWWGYVLAAVFIALAFNAGPWR